MPAGKFDTDITVSDIRQRKVTQYSTVPGLSFSPLDPLGILRSSVYINYEGIKKDDGTPVNFYLINDSLPEDSEVCIRTVDVPYNPLEKGKIFIGGRHLSITSVSYSTLKRPPEG